MQQKLLTISDWVKKTDSLGKSIIGEVKRSALVVFLKVVIEHFGMQDDCQLEVKKYEPFLADFSFCNLCYCSY